MEISVAELERRCGLEPYASYRLKRSLANVLNGDPHNECDGLRQTGRTTNLILKVIARAVAGESSVVYVSRFEVEQFIKQRLPELAQLAGVHVDLGRICFVRPEANAIFDDEINDTKGFL